MAKYKVEFAVTKEDLENYEKYMERVTDYPLYGHSSNLTRTDIIIIGKLMDYEFGNKLEVKVTIEATGGSVDGEDGKELMIPSA